MQSILTEESHDCREPSMHLKVGVIDSNVILVAARLRAGPLPIPPPVQGNTAHQWLTMHAAWPHSTSLSVAR